MANIYLVGFMGVGKTATGRVVAGRLDRSFVDLDEAIEERMGLSIREIFEIQGEGAFREAESAELDRTALCADLVVATGGGAFSSPSNRGLMHRSGGVSIFIDPPWDVIFDRLRAGDANRPKWIDEHHARELYLARLPDYRRASIRIDPDGCEGPDVVAEKVCRALAEVPCAS